MVLEWLTDEDNRELADAIERVNSHMLDQLISSSDYLAVLFCKYCSTSLAINVDPTVNWPPIHPSIHPFIVPYPSSIHHPSFIHLLSILDPFLIHPSVLPPPSSPPPSFPPVLLHLEPVMEYECLIAIYVWNAALFSFALQTKRKQNKNRQTDIQTDRQINVVVSGEITKPNLDKKKKRNRPKVRARYRLIFCLLTLSLLLFWLPIWLISPARHRAHLSASIWLHPSPLPLNNETHDSKSSKRKRFQYLKMITGNV